MQLTALSLALTRAGMISFNPASLFAAGEEGVWFDPSDMDTLYQDSAGTTPVTAVEQPVGLMLDKSKGLVLGAELVTNPGPGFTATTGWTSGRLATLTVVSGKIRATNTSAYGQAYATNTTVVGATYKVTVTVTDPTTTFDIFIGSTGPEAGILYTSYNNPAGTYTFFFTATTTTSYLTLGNSGATVGNSFDLVSATVKELTGNHAIQATSSKRPTLSARYNLLTYSEQFDNAAWAKSGTTITANATTAPDATTTADELFSTAGGTAYIETSSGSLTSGVLYTQSVYAKANTANYICISSRWDGATSSSRTWFNLSTGERTAGLPSPTVSITSAGDGWYRITMTRTWVTTNVFRIFITNSPSAIASATGESIYLWGADLRPADQDDIAYQRVTTATDYDTVGFKPYLSFDGVDDAMATNSIDFSAGDKMTVFAGLRKISDGGAVAGLSAAWFVNNGTFELLAGNVSTGAGPYWSSASKGAATWSAAQAVDTTATYDAPRTDVLASAHDISGDSTNLRINGSSIGTATADKGTGNFGNYPFYIGARGGTELYYKGYLYSLIVRAAESTATDITNTETWVNGKTGAY